MIPVSVPIVQTMSQPNFTYASSELDELGEARNYYRMLMDRFHGHFGERVLEVGAGIGTFADYLVRESGATAFHLVEPAVNHIPALRARFRDDARVQVVHGYLETLPGGTSADSIVMVNVLEHIEDDVETLRAAHARLAPGGALLLFVPAVPQIYGTLDRAFGHYRRYTLPELARKLDAAGFRRERLEYVNFPGVLSWFLAGRVLRKTSLGPGDVRLYDRLVVPLVSALERVWKPPVGQSLLAIALKEGGS